jgi:preprotein translocase subunit SecG
MSAIILIIEIVLVIFSVFLIAVVLLQSGKKTGVAGSVAGGAEKLFGKKKARGYEAKMGLFTKVAAVGMIVLSVALVLIQKFAG